MATTPDQVLDLFKQVAQAQQEVAQAQKETDRKFQETDRRIEQVHKQLSREIGNLGGARGRFVENMVAPACETLFLERGQYSRPSSQPTGQKTPRR